MAAPKTIAIRRGRENDALCVAVLATQVFLDTYAEGGIRPDLAREVLTGYSQEAFARRLADPATTFLLAERFVGEKGDEPHLVAFAEVTVNRPPPVDVDSPGGTAAELVRLYVQRPFQGMGLGTDLLQRAEQVASEQGAEALWLSAWSGNRAALAFYLACGYRTAGTSEYIFEGRTYETEVVVKNLADSR